MKIDFLMKGPRWGGGEERLYESVCNKFVNVCAMCLFVELLNEFLFFILGQEFYVWYHINEIIV